MFEGTAGHTSQTCPRERWRKSTHSVDNGGCVEVANLEHAVAVRDSKDPEGPAPVWDRDEWTSFLVRITAK
jgi:hypothetical protein